MNITTLEVIKLAYHREPSSDCQGIDCGLGMNEEDLVRDSLELRRLGGLLRGKGPELTSAEIEELKRLESTVRDALQEMEDILQPKATSMKIASVLNEPDTLQTATSKPHDSKPAFKRTFFYSSESPYPQMRDKSGTFRIAPPAPTRHQARSKGRANASKSHVNKCRNKNLVPSNVLLQNLELLENLQNLQRLGQNSADVASAAKMPE